MKFIVSIILTVLLIFPQTASAVYYDRAGNPVPSNPAPTPSSYTKMVKTPGIKLSDRKRSTQEYNYIIDYECNINAVNLYLGETLYTCPNGVQFWSNVNIDPSLISLNTKNKSKARDEESDDIVIMSSSSLINMVSP